MVLIALAGLMLQVSVLTRRSAALGYRSAAVQVAQVWMHGLPWDGIPKAVGCVADTIGQLAYTRCTTVADLTARLRRVTAVVAAADVLMAPAESVVIDCVKPLSPSPFRP